MQTRPEPNINIVIVHGKNGDGDEEDGVEDEDGSEWCQATCQAIETCQATCQSPTLFTCTPLAPTTAIQIKKLDYCHHPQIDFCCLGFLDVSNWILTWSSFITRDIHRVSLVVLLLCSTAQSFHFSHTPSQTQFQNAFLILWQIQSNTLVLHNRQTHSMTRRVSYVWTSSM